MIWRAWSEIYLQWMQSWQRSVPGATALPAPSGAKPLLAADDAFSLLCHFSDDVLALFHFDLRCAYLSPSFTHLTGHGCQQEHFYTFVHGDDAEPLLNALQRAAEDTLAQPMLYPLRFRMRHADEEWHWYTLHLGDVHCRGQEKYVVAFLKSATETIRAERMLKEARRQAEIAQKARGEFLNAMSHDLRTPLNAILGFTQMMESGMYGAVENPQYREYLRHIRESGADLLTQIEAIMRMADAEDKDDAALPLAASA